MCTYFATVPKRYQPLTVDGDIETEPFLNACLGIVEFIGFFGKAFIPVKNDVDCNVTKIRNKFSTNPLEYNTIRNIVEKELAYQRSMGYNSMGSATEALLWLKRGLEYFLSLLELLIEDYKSGRKSESLVPLCKVAYDAKLKRHHNFFSKSLFKMAVHATPWRTDLLKMIAFGADNQEAQCIADIETYVSTMKPNVDMVCKLYLEKNLETLPEPDKR